jgi:hypothetical protein
VPPRTGEREHGPRIRRGQTPTKWPTWLFLTETWRLFPDQRAPFAASLVLHHPWGPLPPSGSDWDDWEMGTAREEGGDPMIWTILALACIVFGFVGEIIDERILLGTLEWFVAAIAFNTLGSLPFVKKR